MTGSPGSALIPPGEVETPCLVIDHRAVRHNLARTATACGGVGRLIPHVKTHRAPWLITDLMDQGVAAFKTATPAEVEMVLAAGAREVLWAYPSVNPRAVGRVLAAARRYPEARLSALVDSRPGIDLWRAALGTERPPRVGLRLDIDPGLGRSGVPMGREARALAGELVEAGLFAGWHLYDGHLHDPDDGKRAAAVGQLATDLMAFVGDADPDPAADIVVAGSYTFDLWPPHACLRVSPGGWIYSSLRHARDLSHHEWRQGAYVLATVITAHGVSATLDAGLKAVGSDLPLAERFGWPNGIMDMTEEHSVVGGAGETPGNRVLLTPGHACTTAYLYSEAWVLGLDGGWQKKRQMGIER
ncbi:MAG: alanine racemase [Rhodospirillales bacterium]|jgi:D-serine deaminase-like pyridoxal phosphate-dependent protein|nr:alanine racemase [Rhodospirillales bacterium]